VVAALFPMKKTLWRDHNVTLKMLADGVGLDLFLNLVPVPPHPSGVLRI